MVQCQPPVQYLCYVCLEHDGHCDSGALRCACSPVQCLHVGYTFPYLYDESQQVAKSFKAVCTPEFYIFDSDLKLAYHGQFDSSRPRNNLPVTGAACACLLLSQSTFDVKQPRWPADKRARGLVA